MVDKLRQHNQEENQGIVSKTGKTYKTANKYGNDQVETHIFCVVFLSLFIFTNTPLCKKYDSCIYNQISDGVFYKPEQVKRYVRVLKDFFNNAVRLCP